VVERHPVRNPGAAIVPDDGEAFESEQSHDLDQLTGDLTLGEPLAARPSGRGMTPPVTAQVRGHDRTATTRKGRDQVPPAVVRLRKAVVQQHGIAAVRKGAEMVRLTDTAAAILSGRDRAGRRDGLRCHRILGSMVVRRAVHRGLRYPTCSGWAGLTGRPTAAERGR
jgi:hypothetical protein